MCLHAQQLGLLSRLRARAAGMCFCSHGVAWPSPRLPLLGEWPRPQPCTDLILTPRKVTQTLPCSAGNWVKWGGGRNNASPYALNPFHISTQAALVSAMPGNWIFLPLRVPWGRKGVGAWDSAGACVPLPAQGFSHRANPCQSLPLPLLFTKAPDSVMHLHGQGGKETAMDIRKLVSGSAITYRPSSELGRGYGPIQPCCISSVIY